MAEWSKALDLGSSLSGGVGSNPTFVKLLPPVVSFYLNRSSGIATFLLNNFISPEMKVQKSEICLTDPTDDGAKFAIKYFNRRVLIAR